MTAQFDRETFKKIVLYVCASTEPSKLGAVKLHKVLYFADMLAYASRGRSLTGETYVRQAFGPTARRLLPVLAELESAGLLEINEVDFYGYKKKEFRAKSRPELGGFETRLLEDVLAFVTRMTANEISDFTHDKVWQMLENGEPIPYHTVFLWFPVEITDEDRAWADEVAKQIVTETAG